MITKFTATFIKNKTTILLIFFLSLVLVLAYFGYQKFFGNKTANLQEIDLTFDPNGPYAILSPRRDGNALLLNLKRTSSYDEITYELSYTSKVDETTEGDTTKLRPSKKSVTDEGEVQTGSIDRGVVGTIDTKQKSQEYEQEILFGTCSKNVCKYDKGVENGTLALKIRKGQKLYKMITQWHLQKPDVALGKLSSGDGHFEFNMNSNREDLAQIGFSIINDLTGVPKLPDKAQVLGKVYALNSPLLRDLPEGNVIFELAQNPGNDAKIAKFVESKNSWEELETKIEGNKLTCKSTGPGIFAVLTNH
ncbi:MAG: Uncharacterized protein G01um101493_20 [Microgenomates group bacterium Gr01-1014_93]|nr:MAG: Uncharacterized protein G01um101493_20 [Microgenomates group bacterium Gr01-1014_93]